MKRNQDKFRGCLVGGAIGDALWIWKYFIFEKGFYHMMSNKYVKGGD